jgi:CheY-like chemotaxis protein
LSIDPGNPSLSVLSEAERAVLKASELSKRLLTIATGPAPLKEAVVVKDLVIEAVDFALRGSNVRSEYRFPEDPAWTAQVEVNQAQLDQAVRNIVTNAVEAIPEGGLLRVTVKHITGGADELKARGPFADPDYVKISIQDHGRGIPKQDLGRICDPYFSTKSRGSEKGMGLGLSLAYSIIRRHGGDLQVESEEGIGTVCHIYLPSAEKQEMEGKPPESRAAARRGSILVMDDEEMFREMVVQLLKHLGFKEIELAKDGREAIERFALARQSGKPFDIVLLDLTIRGGMGGVETIKVLREMDPSVKAIICSGYSNDQVISDFRAYGFAGALAKPYLMKQLSDVLAEVGCA